MQTTTDYEAIKERQRAAWQAGDYPRLGIRLQVMAEQLVEAADLRAGQTVLDVACGQGNAAIAAARRFGEVTGVDYAAQLLEQGRARARAEGLPVDFREGDAEDLPFPAESFDLALSTVGVMFVRLHHRPDQRVQRSAGRQQPPVPDATIPG